MHDKILIVDDDTMLVDMLCLNLRAEGYLVDTAFSAKEAMSQLKIVPDLILLDVMMPGENGYELCAEIREHLPCPIVFLSAKVASEDKVNGFRAGGDDYITKPFDMEELFARIAAHIRRDQRVHVRTKIQCSEYLWIDQAKHEVCYHNEKIEFCKKEYEIICLLASHPGQIFEREHMYEAIWGLEGDGDSIVIKEHIRRIRNKLQQTTGRQYIETIWGVGYRWKE